MDEVWKSKMGRKAGLGAALALALLLGACASSNRAPVEDRRPARVLLPTPVPTAGAIPAAEAKPLPGAENAGKPGYYTVRPGDTLIRIGLDSGQNWRDLVRWNNLENPNVIEVGQSLRVTPPVGTSTAEVAAVRPVTPASGVVVPGVGSASEARPGAISQAGPAAGARVADASEDEVPWAWPTAGPPTVLAGFDEARNKGLDIGGKAGDAVLASADGRVVYAGAGLRGYGNLIILKHNNTYLTAYAHNQALLVKEDQNVRKGQKIAEMGNSDADRVKLHFEIRKQGKPVDPSKYLPR